MQKHNAVVENDADPDDLKEVVVAGIAICNQHAVKTKVGGKWAKIAPLLEVQVGKYLNKRMQEEDLLFREQELTYHMVMHGLSAQDAAFSIGKTASGVYEAIFLRDPVLEELQISVSVAPLRMPSGQSVSDVKNIVIARDRSLSWAETIGRGNFASYRPEKAEHKLLKQIFGLRSACDALISSPNGLPQSDQAFLNHQSELGRMLFTMKGAVYSIEKLLSGQQLEDSVRDNQETTPSVELTPAPAPKVSSYERKLAILNHDAMATLGSDIELVYMPIWNVKEEVVNSYRCAIVRHLPSGTGELNAGTETEYAPFKIDELVLRKLVLDLKEGGLAEDESSFVLPLHINTVLTESDFLKISAALNSLTLVERQKLKVELLGMTKNTSLGLVQKAISKIKGYGKETGLRAMEAGQVIPQLKKTGVTHIGLHLADLQVTNMDADKEIEAFATNADELRFRAFIYGVDRVADAAQAIGAGFGFISGQSIGDALSAPWGTVPFKVSSLYSRMISG